MVLSNALLLKLRNNTTSIRKGAKARRLSSHLLKYLVSARRTVIGNVLYDSYEIPFRRFGPSDVVAFFHFILAFRILSTFAKTSSWGFDFPSFTSCSPWEMSFKMPMAFRMFS